MSDFAETVLEKVSAYNLFNYLLPGAVFVAAFTHVSARVILSGNIVVDLVVMYFVGMVLSRLGSILIEPLFKWLRIVKYAPYTAYLEAERTDPKLPTLTQENNTYRTFTAVFLLLIAAKTMLVFQRKFPNVDFHLDWVWPVALFLLFALSFRKQSAYIRKRVSGGKE